MVSEVADYIVSLGPNGRIISQGSIDDALRSNPKLQAEVEVERQLETQAAPVIEDPNAMAGSQKPNGKLMVAEEVALGHIGWPALRLFLLALGGTGFWLAYLAGFLLANLVVLLQTYWLG